MSHRRLSPTPLPDRTVIHETFDELSPTQVLSIQDQVAELLDDQPLSARVPKGCDREWDAARQQYDAP